MSQKSQSADPVIDRYQQYSPLIICLSVKLHLMSAPMIKPASMDPERHGKQMFPLHFGLPDIQIKTVLAVRRFIPGITVKFPVIESGTVGYRHIASIRKSIRETDALPWFRLLRRTESQRTDRRFGIRDPFVDYGVPFLNAAENSVFTHNLFHFVSPLRYEKAKGRKNGRPKTDRLSRSRQTMHRRHHPPG